MSRILFRYIFWDLFRIFMMANGALAGIMSFAGLLKPLTHNGLDAGQVGKLLTWFTPAMCAYSFPVAALFAATVVYGRLSADNEITACRASGIPHYMIALPALVLGLVVAIISLLFLCFIVPASTLKVEKVIYSNLAAFMQSKIERNHQIRMPGTTVFAQQAEIIPPDPDKPYLQRLVLDSPTIITYERPSPGLKGHLIPDEFWMARKATLYIQTDPEGDNAELTAVLDGGMKFPRKNRGGWEGGVEVTQFGPLMVPSRVKENTKFMDIKQLKELEKDTRKSRRIANLRLQFIAEEQETMLHTRVQAGLAKDNQYVFAAGRDVYSLSKNPEDTCAIKSDRDRLVITSKSGRTVRLTQERNGVPTLDAHAGEVRVRIRSDVKAETLNVTLELVNVVLHEPDGDIERGLITQGFTVAMPPDIAAVGDMPVEKYANKDDPISTRRDLWRELLILRNDIAAELNSRGAFAVSCLFLVIAGCALGMMFKSGNFLSAFALSFIPAILCITLIIAGQKTCGNVPQDIAKLEGFRDPLKLGIAIIWSGNATVAALGGVLMWRLHRT